MMNLAGEAMGWKPFNHCVGIEKCPVDPFGRCAKNTMKPDNICRHDHLPFLQVMCASFNSCAGSIILLDVQASCLFHFAVGSPWMIPKRRPPGSAQVAYHPMPGIGILGSITSPPLAWIFAMASSRLATGTVS